MNKEEIEYWLKIFANNKHAFMSSDGKKIGYYEILKQLQKREHNWNELKKWLEENRYFYSGLQGEDLEEDSTIKEVLDKMQELEEGRNNGTKITKDN